MTAYGQPPPPAKRSNALIIVLTIIAVAAVTCVGLCAVGVIYVKKAATRVADSIIDGGGLVFESPPAVTAELAGAKKDYVGHWSSSAGSELDIAANGTLHFVNVEGLGREEMNSSIAGFAGDDIQLKIIVAVTIRVSTPPHKVGGRWEMVADGVRLQR
jgi:hypothetical protein